MIIPPIIIIISSIYAYINTGHQILLIPIFLSIFAFISTALLIYLCRDATNTNNRVSDSIFYCIYAIHFSTTGYFSLGLLLIFLFGFQNTLSPYVNFAILCIEGACLKCTLGYGLLFIICRKLSIEYHSIRNYLEIIQITILLCGTGMCMTCIAYRSS